MSSYRHPSESWGPSPDRYAWLGSEEMDASFRWHDGEMCLSIAETYHLTIWKVTPYLFPQWKVENR